jgi:uncharacterized protein YjbJ (UPF0337 family)
MERTRLPVGHRPVERIFGFRFRLPRHQRRGGGTGSGHLLHALSKPTAEQSHEAEGCRADFRDNNVTTRGVEPMNWDRVEGNWKTFKGQVQQKWGKLTDDDLDVIEGKRTELAGRLQQRYGYAKDEAEKNIDSWLKNIH